MTHNAKRIVIIRGHPDPGGNHFCHALAQAYVKGATEAGHEYGIYPALPIKIGKQFYPGPGT
jgi:hypothetical protein